MKALNRGRASNGKNWREEGLGKVKLDEDQSREDLAIGRPGEGD